MSELWVRWLSAFALTQAVELPIYFVALHEREPAPVKRLWLALAIAFGASAVTHPIVWFVIPKLITDDWMTMVLVAEVFAIAVEALWLWAFGLRQPLAWAAFANAASVLIGGLSRALFDWP